MLTSDTKLDISGSDFAFSAVVELQRAYYAVGCARKGHESGAWSVTPFSALNVGN
jgi:hypothetical protein